MSPVIAKGVIPVEVSRSSGGDAGAAELRGIRLEAHEPPETSESTVHTVVEPATIARAIEAELGG